MLKVKFNNQVVAEIEKENIIEIEGNMYFPQSSIHPEFFVKTENHSTCPWKGEASYYSIKVADQTAENAAWYYPVPKEGSVEKVGKDFANYAAFYTDKVQISEE